MTGVVGDYNICLMNVCCSRYFGLNWLFFISFMSYEH